MRILFVFFALCSSVVLAQESTTPAAAETPANQDGSAIPGLDTARFLVTQLRVTRTELHEWDRYVRGFRRNHNFSVSTGMIRSEWEVNRYEELSGRRQVGSGVYSKAQYSLHIQLIGKFGYQLGSSFGYLYEPSDTNQEFGVVDSVMFPSALFGLVYNFTPGLRISASVDAYLERYTDLEDRSEVEGDTNPHEKIGITMETYDFIGAFDYFYTLNWGLRLEGHFRKLFLERPQKAQGKSVDANIRKSDRWFGAGLVYHLI